MYRVETIMRAGEELAGNVMVEEGCMEYKGIDLHLWRSIFGGLTKFDLVRER